MKTLSTVAGDSSSVTDGIREATKAIKHFSRMSGRQVSKHAAGHAGEKQRRKERTRAKNRVAKVSRRAGR